MATRVDHSIRPLPQNVISQLKSSVTITSLADCIQQLVMNSLDASATNITLSVNLTRNSITIQDDGDGILPSDMIYIGQRYATSKVHTSKTTSESPSRTTFGYHGESLSSMSTHSYFTLASRHREYRSTHTVRLYHGSILHRGQITIDSHMLLSHGTTVTIDQLWGNMPVRLKAREAIGVEREWNDIRRIIIELALVSKGVKFVVRDENGNKRVNLGEGRPRIGSTHDLDERDHYLRVLGQTSNAADLPSASNWENITANQGSLSIHGIMSNIPSASKTYQYLYINGLPVPYSKASLLFLAVTGSFSSSNFGRTLEETTSSPRINSRTGIERHPSFVLTITTETAMHVEDVDYNKTGALSDIVLFLQHVVEEFLKFGGWKRKTSPWPSDRKTKGENNENLAVTRPCSQEKKDLLKVPDESLSKQGRSIMMDMSQWSRVKSSESNISKHKFTVSSKNRVSEEMSKPADEFDDETIVKWTDPSTFSPLLVDSRTGNVLHKHSLAKSDQLGKSRITLPLKLNKTATLENLSNQSLSKASTDLLHGINNSIFAMTEQQIPQLFNTDKAIINEVKRGRVNHEVALFDKLSRASLKGAQVVAQVDEKYILIKLINISGGHVLVMVDQHAADERVRVEALWKEFFSPSTQAIPIQKHIAFSLTKYESTLFMQHSSTFAHWHITYHLIQSPPQLVVKSLPSVVLDRCLEQPDLVISLLRTYVRELEEDNITPNFNTHGSWISRISKAPKILIDMINSKSCRSAIMFNDHLDVDACRVLIRRLAGCDLPFQCAHGRPSMIPIVDLSVETRDENLPVINQFVGATKMKMFMEKAD